MTETRTFKSVVLASHIAPPVARASFITVTLRRAEPYAPTFTYTASGTPSDIAAAADLVSASELEFNGHTYTISDTTNVRTLVGSLAFDL